MTEVCIVGPCSAPRVEGSQYCSSHGPRNKMKVPARASSTCPRCGSANLVPKRKTSTKVLLGVVSLLGRPQHAECASCGYVVRRPN